MSTTSNKPLSFIRSDILRVLRQLAIDYTEIKGGFSCRYVPSEAISQTTESGPASPDQAVTSPAQAHRRRISFGGFINNDRDREDEKAFQKAKSPSRRRGPDASFTASEDSEDDIRRRINCSNRRGDDHARAKRPWRKRGPEV